MCPKEQSERHSEAERCCSRKELAVQGFVHPCSPAPHSCREAVSLNIEEIGGDWPHTSIHRQKRPPPFHFVILEGEVSIPPSAAGGCSARPVRLPKHYRYFCFAVGNYYHWAEQGGRLASQFAFCLPRPVFPSSRRISYVVSRYDASQSSCRDYTIYRYDHPDRRLRSKR